MNGRGLTWGMLSLPFVLLLSFLAASFGGCLCGCSSDDSEPDPFPVLGITEIDGYAEVLAQLKDQVQEASSSNLKTVSEELVVEERLGVQIQGFSYHPNLIEFTLAAVIGSLQHDYTEDRTTSDLQGDDLGVIAEIELSADILRHKPYPGRIHIQQDQTTQSRAFRSSLQTTRSIQGIFWRLEDETHPLHARFEHRRFTYEPLDDSDPGGFSETLSFGAGGTWRFDSDHQIRLDYEHLNLEEEPSGLDYASDELTLIHSLDWGDKNHLETRLEYLDQYGNYEIRRLRGRTDLRMSLIENLTGRLAAEYRDQERSVLFGNSTVTDETIDLFGGLGYRLYDSVVANLEAYYRTQDLNSESETQEYGGRFDLNYRKKNALGRLRINYTFYYDIDDRRSATGLPVDVFDESHTFNATERFFLDNRRVLLTSIVVTDAANVTVYQEGMDYMVRTLGDQVEIERLLGGTLVAGQTVLIDYRFDVGGSFRLRGMGHSIGVSQDFDFGLSLGYLFRTQDQELVEGTVLDAAFESFNAHTLRASFRWEKLEARAQYETFDSNITENESLRAGVSWIHAFSFGGRLSLNADWNQRRELRPTPRDTSYYSFGAQYRQRFFGSLDFNLGARWRLGFDDVAGDTEGINIDANIIWSQGETEFRGSFIYNELDGDFSSNSSSTILLQLRRKF